jgi:hypothetical protein
VSDFVGDKQCVTHHACDCIMAERDRLTKELDTLRKGLQDEVAFLRDCANQTGLYSQRQADLLRTEADRLSALLDSEGEK